VTLQSADVDEEAELNIFCVTCGIALSPRVALRHMEKCFNKVISVTAALASHPPPYPPLGLI